MAAAKKGPGGKKAAGAPAAGRDYSGIMKATNIDLKEAEKWLPPCAHIMKHQYDGRWRLVFKGLAAGLPGKSSSWTSKGPRGEAESLNEVISEGWCQWADLSGEACPHKGF